jgi:hypothetical protein
VERRREKGKRLTWITSFKRDEERYITRDRERERERDE